MPEGKFLRTFPWLRQVFPNQQKAPAQPETLPDALTLTYPIMSNSRYIQPSVGGFVAGQGGFSSFVTTAVGAGTVTAVAAFSTLAVHYLIAADVYHNAVGNFVGEIRLDGLEGTGPGGIARINVTDSLSRGNSTPIFLPRPYLLPGGAGIQGRFFSLPAATTVTLTVWVCSVVRGEEIPVL